MIAAALALIKGLSWQTWLVVALGATALGIYAEKTSHIKLLEHELTSKTKDVAVLTNEIAMARDLAVKTEADNKAKETKVAADQKEISMSPNASRFARATTVLALALLLPACSLVPKPLPVVVKPPAIPRLPPEAHQQKEPACDPSCSAVLAMKLSAMQPSPMSPASGVLTAKPSTTP